MHAFRVATWISLLGLAMTAQAQTTQRQYQLQKTGDAPPVLKLVEAPVRQPDAQAAVGKSLRRMAALPYKLAR